MGRPRRRPALASAARRCVHGTEPRIDRATAPDMERPGSTDDPGRDHAGSGGSYATHTERTSSAAALATEAIAAVDRLAAGRSEGDLGLFATGRAGGREHLAGATVVAATTATAAAIAAGATGVAARAITAAGAVRAATALAVTSSLAAGSAGGAAAGLGEATLRVKILLGRSEHEFLSTVRAGQILVVVHENENSSR